MSSLQSLEKRIIEDLFDMSSGYVLGLTNRQFADVFSESGLDIYDEKYAFNGDSKAKRLRAFWEVESDPVVGQVLESLLAVWKYENDKSGSPTDTSDYNKGQKIAARLLSERTHLLELGLTSLDNEDISLWEPDKLKLFISHRDSKKIEAKKLAEQLESHGMTCFVAHDTIEPMSLWKHEILKALHTMEAFVCFITNDFYDSEWTNQEVGFAIAKGVPVYLYSHDKTDPKGFKLDRQAVKTGVHTLIDLIRKDFTSHTSLRQAAFDRVIEAKNGSFDNAKNQFVEIVGLDLTDSEIEALVEAIQSPARYINQLNILLSDDPLKGEHVQRFKKRSVTHYRDLLKSILDQHSEKRFEIKQQGERRWIIEDHANEITKNLVS